MNTDDWERIVKEIWEVVKDHPDDCYCRDCIEYEILTEK